MAVKREMRIPAPIGTIADGCKSKSNPGWAGQRHCSKGVEVHVHDVSMYIRYHLLTYVSEC